MIELLVVISIIALLVGILLPALGLARGAARSMQSLSNVRQWGVGTHGFVTERNERLPWDGEDGDSAGHMTENRNSPEWWANAVPPLLGQPRYFDGPVVLPPASSIYTDPIAQVPAAVQAAGGYINDALPFFFCYVPNSRLDTDGTSQTHGTVNPERRLRMNEVPMPSSTVFMLEKRTANAEMAPATDPLSETTTAGLGRAKAHYSRFARRHGQGGHILFGDGHGENIKHAYALTQGDDFVDATTAVGMNKPDLIWNPKGLAAP